MVCAVHTGAPSSWQSTRDVGKQYVSDVMALAAKRELAEQPGVTERERQRSEADLVRLPNDLSVLLSWT